MIATSLIDSVFFRDIVGTEAMRRVWPDENRTLRYLDIEAALRGHKPASVSFTARGESVRREH